MNGFPEKLKKISKIKFRILIVNNKFQTGFELMLHTMYVDRNLVDFSVFDFSLLTEPCQVN